MAESLSQVWRTDFVKKRKKAAQCCERNERDGNDRFIRAESQSDERADEGGQEIQQKREILHHLFK